MARVVLARLVIGLAIACLGLVGYLFFAWLPDDKELLRRGLVILATLLSGAALYWLLRRLIWK